MFGQDMVHCEADAKISKCYFTIWQRMCDPPGEGWHRDTPRGHFCQAFYTSLHFILMECQDLKRTGKVKARGMGVFSPKDT